MKSRARFPLLLLLVLPAALLAYGTRIHRLLPAKVLAGSLWMNGLPIERETLPPVRAADLDAFRRALWERAAHLTDTATRRAFLARYPDAASFSPVALKELLMMNGAARVVGIDVAPDSAIPLVSGLELGSVSPDLDRRNQDRLLRDSAGAVRLARNGDSIPFDPMTLNMGRLTGLSSQAHAHMGLNPGPKSADPATLKKEPWNFATAVAFEGPVETYAPDNAQLYTDLAVLAAIDGKPATRTLSALYAGNAMHYLADVGNAVHTIQVGIYPIFVDATIQYWIRRALKLFGLLGRSPSRNSIGIDIVSNLHTYSERLFETELVEAVRLDSLGRRTAVDPSMRPALDALRGGNDSLAQAIADTFASLGPTPDFGRAIATLTIRANMRDGAEVYRLTRDIISRPLRLGRTTMDFDTVPDARVWSFARVRRDTARHIALDDFNAVHVRGLARTSTALRTWWLHYLLASHPAAADKARAADAILTRFLKERLAYLAAAEARRATWIAAHGGLR
jgi:hypothetical protein